MNTDNFCYWLKGYLTNHQGVMSPEQIDEIKQMLDDTFRKKIPFTMTPPLPVPTSRWQEEDTKPGIE